MPECFRQMSEDEFFEFCMANRNLRIERTAEGDLVVMPPAGGETSISNANIAGQLGNWAEVDGTGCGFDSSTGFTFPSKAVYSPDVSWILKSRWKSLPKTDRQRFAYICPDFMIELKSAFDSMPFIESKMEEYAAHGARLGWLIDLELHRVHVYRPNRAVVILDGVSAVSADPELPGFTLELGEIFDPDAE
ncbi:MAG: Uma2 family endonuclease [Bryobacteraceae bacterium]